MSPGRPAPAPRPRPPVNAADCLKIGSSTPDDVTSDAPPSAQLPHTIAKSVPSEVAELRVGERPRLTIEQGAVRRDAHRAIGEHDVVSDPERAGRLEGEEDRGRKLTTARGHDHRIARVGGWVGGVAEMLVRGRAPREQNERVAPARDLLDGAELRGTGTWRQDETGRPQLARAQGECHQEEEGEEHSHREGPGPRGIMR